MVQRVSGLARPADQCDPVTFCPQVLGILKTAWVQMRSMMPRIALVDVLQTLLIAVGESAMDFPSEGGHGSVPTQQQQQQQPQTGALGPRQQLFLLCLSVVQDAYVYNSADKKPIFFPFDMVNGENLHGGLFAAVG